MPRCLHALARAAIYLRPLMNTKEQTMQAPIRWFVSIQNPDTRLQYRDDDGNWHEVPLVQEDEPPYTGEEVSHGE
jgi:hypothetical protein